MPVARQRGAIRKWSYVCVPLFFGFQRLALGAEPGASDSGLMVHSLILGINLLLTATILVLVLRRKNNETQPQIQAALQMQTSQIMQAISAQGQSTVEAIKSRSGERESNMMAESRRLLEESTQMLNHQKKLIEKAQDTDVLWKKAALQPVQSRPVPTANSLKDSPVWPACFREAPMDRWREDVETKMSDGDQAALDLFLAVGRFHSAIRKQEPRKKLAEALHNLGEQACSYCQQAPQSGTQFMHEWRTAVQEILKSAGVQLEIVPALERDRFDMDYMVADDTRSSGRTYVKTPLSWAVRDITTPVPRVMHHARVITD